MKLRVHLVDVQGREDMIDEIRSDDGAEAASSDREGLDDHIRMRRERFVAPKGEGECQMTPAKSNEGGRRT